MTQQPRKSSQTPNAERRATTGGHAPNARQSGQRSTIDAYPSQNPQAASYGIAGTANGPAGLVRQAGLSQAAMTFLEARGLDVELADRLGIVTAIGRDGGEWLAIPYRANGTVVNHKYRSIEGKNWMQDAGAKQVLWNVDCLADETLREQPVIITEGEFDAIAAMQAGYARVLSMPGGAPSKQTDSGAKYQPVVDVLDKLQACDCVILASDGDDPGQALMQDLAKRIGRGLCKYLRYPKGCKDLNDALIGWGEKGVTETIARARWCHVPGLSLFLDLPPIPRAEQYDCGMPGLAAHYRLRKGDFCVTTGIPGSGKTTWWNDVSARMAVKHGWKTCYASLEQPPQTEYFENMCRWLHGKPYEKQTDGEWAEAEDFVQEHFAFVTPPEDEAADLDWLLECMGTAVVRYGVDMCIIDPWNELEHKRSRDQSGTEYIGESIRTLKRFARQMDVHLVVVAHPRKMPRDGQNKPIKPTAYDISDSSHWYNKADVVCVIHPSCTDDGFWFTQCDIQKTKYHDRIGKPGVLPLTLDVMTGRYDRVMV